MKEIIKVMLDNEVFLLVAGILCFFAIFLGTLCLRAYFEQQTEQEKIKAGWVLKYIPGKVEQVWTKE